MPRTAFRAVPFAVLVGALALASSARPAAAQFGSIFSDQPPRPPSSVPQPYRPPPQYAPPPPQYTPPQYAPPPQYTPQQQTAIPPRPPASDIQSESLPPPPGSPVPGVAPGSPPAPAVQPAALPQPGGAMGPRGAPLPPANSSPANPPPPANTAPQRDEEVITEMPTQKIANPIAVFSGLDKITGRITSFDVKINETVQFGALQVTPRACYTRPPTETPNTDAFIEVDEVTLQGDVKRIFTGWMFAASPGLHAVEHPIYDVWLTDCKGATPAVAEAPPPPPARSPALHRPPPRPPHRHPVPSPFPPLGR